MKKLLLGMALVWALAAQPLAAAELKILLPLGRTAYQTNEWIDVSVVRTAEKALQAGKLRLTLRADHGGGARFVFDVPAAAVEGKQARRTEHLHVDGRLLRPGKYDVEVTCDGAAVKAAFEVYSHVRKSTFRLIDWGCGAKGAEQARLGEDGMGFNLIYASYGGHDQDANIRGGLDYMRNCTMGGAHQMDGRLECDWSDPYVMAGGMARAARQALADRTCGNVVGAHFYDEPGLTWQKHPKTGVFTGHGIPAQERAFRSAFDREPPQYFEVKPDDPASVARWADWCRWKLAFMDAAWKLGAFSVNYVRPDYLTATQSVYGWHAFGDGYYFNIVRSLPVISGHGGYDDYAGGYLNAGYFAEFGRIRDLNKPFWYLPTWFHMPSERYRLEQYLTFMTNVQGMAKPPTYPVHAPGKQKGSPDAGIVETNKLMGRLGTIFTTLPVARHELAVLYSMSQNVQAMVRSKNLLNFQDFPGQVERLELLFVAGKMARIPIFPLVEEDVLDGTLAANHKAIVLVGIDRLRGDVVKALEAYAAGGGKVILGDECTVQIKGATRLGATVTDKIYREAAKAFRSKPGNEGRIAGLLARRPGVYFKEAAPIARALTRRCKEVGIAPAAECDNPQVFVARHALGDVEYFFLVNASCDDAGALRQREMNAIQPAETTFALPDDGRPIYDAVLGGTAEAFRKKGGKLSARLRFGPGQMRVYARTSRPIGGVRVLSPVLPAADYTLHEAGIRVEVQALLMDEKGAPLVGSVPLAVKVVDPLGVKRYDLYRATDQGLLKLTVPLTANDPAGQWTVVVRELLSGKEGRAAFTFRGPAQCGALAGATRRAVYFGRDDQNVFRFFRLHKDVTIVPGTSPFNEAQAKRLAAILKPWGVRCEVVPAAEAAKRRQLPPEAKRTWTGLVGGGSTGFSVRGPAILLGNPKDNAIIKYLLAQRFLPYKPIKDEFPGRGRGYVAWQADGVGFYNQESITLIAYDEGGMAEAVGTLYEWASGLDPLTKWILPETAAVTPARQAVGVHPPARVVWEAALPDRVLGLETNGDKLRAVTLDATLTVLGPGGKIASQKVLPQAEARALAAKMKGKPAKPAAAHATPARVIKFVAPGDGLTAVGYWGGLLKTFDAEGRAKTSQMMPQDIGGVVWQGRNLVVGLADGRVIALRAD